MANKFKGYYTGIGSRRTPQRICDMMRDIAARLEREGYVLRSGGADGADKAFASGVRDPRNMRIYLPWNNFNGQVGLVTGDDMNAESVAKGAYDQAHGEDAWRNASRGVKALMRRNVHQVLGAELTVPSKFVICWTQGAKGGGGTGQALRIAAARRIKVFDMGDQAVLDRLYNYIRGRKA